MTAKFRQRTQLHLLTGFIAGFISAFVLLIYVYDVNHTSSCWPSTVPITTTRDELFLAQSRIESLAVGPRVLCMVLTCPENLEREAKNVYATWGQRCSKLIFASSENYEPLGVVQVVEADGGSYADLWNKTREGFRYVWQIYGQDYDWFLKADDDTYVIMENLRYMLSYYDPDMPVYFGYKMTRYNVSYMSGGASYVLSRQALNRFMLQAYPSEIICPQPKKMGIEDFYMGICLQNVGVHLIDSSQALEGDDKPKFMPLDLQDYLLSSNSSNLPDWLHLMSLTEVKTGLNCCSKHSIAFHYTSAERMYLYEFLLYHLQIFGHHLRTEPVIKQITYAELMERFPLENNSVITNLQQMSEKPNNF
ncbi:glycoprotein-N-acetylgalactosamine 3-beta-galactosyltransferase 1 [Drosophila tropicalis]|uniref:glycoprotein-N-acetylgalactosamine 3-beta-galactosyltransferase 1 n=1 Tax=Drosophila tropicalis TaxID=46794 RepID=UPI0035AB799C